jgi:hypothetical protein
VNDSAAMMSIIQTNGRESKMKLKQLCYLAVMISLLCLIGSPTYSGQNGIGPDPWNNDVDEDLIEVWMLYNDFEEVFKTFRDYFEGFMMYATARDIDFNLPKYNPGVFVDPDTCMTPPFCSVTAKQWISALAVLESYLNHLTEATGELAGQAKASGHLEDNDKINFLKHR